MTQPTPIYGCADVAKLLRVSYAAVSNYLRRHTDTPAPEYVSTDGRAYWTAAGMARWQAWQANRAPHHKTARAAGSRVAVERLRAELGAESADISLS